MRPTKWNAEVIIEPFSEVVPNDVIEELLYLKNKAALNLPLLEKHHKAIELTQLGLNEMSRRTGLSEINFTAEHLHLIRREDLPKVEAGITLQAFADINRIYICEDVLEENFLNVLLHESIHYSSYYKLSYFCHETKISISPKVCGYMRFNKCGSFGSFHALNEAVTERIAVDIRFWLAQNYNLPEWQKKKLTEVAYMPLLVLLDAVIDKISTPGQSYLTWRIIWDDYFRGRMEFFRLLNKRLPGFLTEISNFIIPGDYFKFTELVKNIFKKYNLSEEYLIHLENYCLDEIK